MRISDWSSDVCSSDLEQEQPDRLQRLDCGVRKAPIEVTDEDYQAIYLGVLQEFSELLPEGMHLFRRIVLGDFAQKLRSDEHTSELQSLMRISYAVFCLKNKNIYKRKTEYIH